MLIELSCGEASRRGKRRGRKEEERTDDFQNALSLLYIRQPDSKSLWHSSEESKVDVVRSIGCAENEYSVSDGGVVFRRVGG
jgi:hypothetical protein